MSTRIYRRLIRFPLILSSMAAGIMMFSIFSSTCISATLYVSKYVAGDHTTIQAAVNAASPGDNIIVRAGTYYESVSIDRCITLQSLAGWEYTFIEAPSPDRAVLVSDANDVTIDGFSMYAATGDGTECVILDNSDNSTLKNNRIGWDLTHRNDIGIRVFWSDGCTVSGNLCAWNNYNGIEVYNGNNNKIINNYCDMNGERGIEVQSGTGNQVDSNFCRNNNHGIYLEDAPGNTVVGNDCSFNSMNGIWLLNSDANLVRGNGCFYNGLYYSGIAAGSSDNNHFIRNVLRFNDYGLSLSLSSGNFIVGNYMDDNAVGLEIGGYCFYNTFYFNEFALNSSVNLQSAPTSDSYWDSSLKVLYNYGDVNPPPIYGSRVGNYYSHHSDSDSNADGILDTPFSPIAGETDIFPLASHLGSYPGNLVVSEPFSVSGDYCLVFDSVTITDPTFGGSTGKLMISGGTLSIGSLLPPTGDIL